MFKKIFELDRNAKEQDVNSYVGTAEKMMGRTLVGDEKNSLLNQYYTQLEKRGGNIISSVKAGADSMNSNKNPLRKGLDLAETGLDTAGEVAGGALDAVKPIVSPFMKKASDTLTKVPGFERFANSSFMDTVFAGGEDIGKHIEEIRKNHPEAVKNLESAGNIISLLMANQLTKNVDTSKAKMGLSVEDVSKNIKVTDGLKDAVSKELFNLDTTPPTVNGKPFLGNADANFRLSQLQDTVKKRALTVEETREAATLLKNQGIDLLGE